MKRILIASSIQLAICVTATCSPCLAWDDDDDNDSKPFHQPNPLAFCRSSIPKLGQIFLGGVCAYDHPLGGWGVGVVVGGFLDRIAQPNQRLESGMRGAF